MQIGAIFVLPPSRHRLAFDVLSLGGKVAGHAEV
jgi:hypothetical protein